MKKLREFPTKSVALMQDKIGFKLQIHSRAGNFSFQLEKKISGISAKNSNRKFRSLSIEKRQNARER